MSLTIGQLFGILWRRKLMFIGFWLLMAGVCIAYIRQLPPEYTSTALLMVDPRQIHFTDLTGVQDSNATSDLNFVRSEMQIMDSDDIARQVVEALDLANDPEFAPHQGFIERNFGPFLARIGIWNSGADHPPPASIDAIVSAYQSRFATSNDARSFTIGAAFTASSPAMAQRILAKHIELYLADQRAAKQAVIRKAEAWFAQELDNLHAKVVASEDRQQQFRLENGLLRTAGETTPGRQLTSVTTQLAGAQADLLQKTARYRQLSEVATGAGGSSADTMAVTSGLVQQLRQQAALAAQHISQLSAKYGPGYPDVVAAKAELTSLNERIAGEQNRLVESAQADVAIARANVDRLQASLDQLQHQVGATSDAELTAAQLARESEADQRLYADLLSRSKQVAVQRETQEPDASLISSATLPQGRTSPHYGILTIVALTGTALLSGAFTFATEQIRQDRFDNLSGLQAASGIPGLAIVPRIKLPRRQQGTALLPHTVLAASFQTLGNSIVVRSNASETKAVVFTSAVAGDGKTFVSVLFAHSLAAQGMRVLLIDGDLRRHGLSRMMRIAPRGTLPELLQGTRSLAECITRDPDSGVDVVASGRTATDPAHVLELSRIRRMLSDLRTTYDMIVIDTPPIGAVDDALPFASLADATVLVVRSGSTPQNIIQGALQRLQFGGANVVGAVLNAADIGNRSLRGIEAYRLSSSYLIQSD
jgi:capsular exopolysaccharide synthesis family protein